MINSNCAQAWDAVDSVPAPAAVLNARPSQHRAMDIVALEQTEIRIPLSKARVMKDAILRVEASSTQIYGSLLQAAASMKAELQVLSRAKMVLSEITGEI